MTGPDYEGLLDDLDAEEAALDRVVADLNEDGWRTATPAAGWDVRDSLAHLAFSEELARATLEDPSKFEAERDALLDAGEDALVGRGRAMPGAAVLEWWRDSRAAVQAGLRSLDGRDRLLWFAGPMSATSFATARLMETWAHGQRRAAADPRPTAARRGRRARPDRGPRSP